MKLFQFWLVILRCDTELVMIENRRALSQAMQKRWADTAIYSHTAIKMRSYRAATLCNNRLQFRHMAAAKPMEKAFNQRHLSLYIKATESDTQSFLNRRRDLAVGEPSVPLSQKQMYEEHMFNCFPSQGHSQTNFQDESVVSEGHHRHRPPEDYKPTGLAETVNTVGDLAIPLHIFNGFWQKKTIAKLLMDYKWKCEFRRSCATF